MKQCKSNLIATYGEDANYTFLSSEFEKQSKLIKMDVAWQIFDEVNYKNDTYQHIDLSCLDVDDAIKIAKFKIIDLAIRANEHYLETDEQIDWILNIKCAEDHLVIIEDLWGRQPLKNSIQEMI